MALIEAEPLSEQGLIFGASAGSENIRARLAAFQALEPITPAVAFADIGCGHGGYSAELAPLCQRISLVDIQQANIDATRRALAGRPSFAADFHCGPAEELPFESEAYDAVFLIEVLDHVRDVAACLNEAFRMLRSGGRCYLSVPNRLFPWETHPVKFRGMLLTPYLFPFLPWCRWLHGRMATARVFTPSQLKLVARQAGFRRIKFTYVMPPLARTGFTFLRDMIKSLEHTPLKAFGVSIAAVLTK